MKLRSRFFIRGREQQLGNVGKGISWTEIYPFPAIDKLLVLEILSIVHLATKSAPLLPGERFEIYSTSHQQMIKRLSIIFVLSICSNLMAQQTIWYENSSNIDVISFISGSQGVFTEDVANPDTSGVNPRATVARFVRNQGATANAF